MRTWMLLNPMEVYCVRDKDIVLCGMEFLRRKLYGRSLRQLYSQRMSLASLGRRNAGPPPGFDMEEEKQDSGESMC